MEIDSLAEKLAERMKQRSSKPEKKNKISSAPYGQKQTGRISPRRLGGQ